MVDISYSSSYLASTSRFEKLKELQAIILNDSYLLQKNGCIKESNVKEILQKNQAEMGIQKRGDVPDLNQKSSDFFKNS